MEFDNVRIMGVIFDFDGTLIESTIDYSAMKDAMLGVISMFDVPEGVVDRRRSSADNIISAWDHISRTRDSNDVHEFERMVNEASIEIELKDVDKTMPVKGAQETLDHLHDKGIKTGILTRGSREYVEKGLKVAGLVFEKNSIVCRNDHRLMEAKPNPISMSRAARAIGKPLKNCIYVGDHQMDLQCAKAAGVEFVGVLSGYNDIERWKGLDVDILLNSIESLPALTDRRLVRTKGLSE